jgi:hypothetical protein
MSQIARVRNCILISEAPLISADIRSVEYVLNSLVTPPGALVSPRLPTQAEIDADGGQICSGHWFVEEEEEVREIAQRLIPDIKLIMVPSDLNIEADDKKQATVDYLTEQLDAWKSGKEE